MQPTREDIIRILQSYNKKDFERRYSQDITSVLEKIIYADVGIVLYSIAETVKNITPDSSVDNLRFAAGEITTKIVHATTSSVEHLFLRRRKYPPDSNSPKSIQFHLTSGKHISEFLSETTSGMTARDAGIFLGILAGLYIKTCPVELYEIWVKRINENRFWSLFRIGTMQGALSMSIYF